MSNITNKSLFEKIKNLIEQTKQNVAISVNSSLTAYNGVFEQCFQKYLNTFSKNKF